MNPKNKQESGDASAATLVLDVDDLSRVLDQVGVDQFLDELIGALNTAIGSFEPEKVEHQIRRGFNYEWPEVGLVEWMPTMTVGDVVAIKTVGYHPKNPVARNLPSVLASTSLYDTKTGQLTAVCEATLLTALRTGAASAMMTNALVRPGPIVLGVVGCGAQAVTQIHAISRVRTVTKVLATDIDEANAKSLQTRLPPGIADIEVLDISTFEDRVGELDVLCTCTSVESEKGPVLNVRDARPDLHINAVGSDFPGKIEIPVDYLRSSVVVADVVEQCLIEGEAQQLTVDDLGPDMVEVLSDPAHRELVSQRTVFDSTGWSYEDLIVAQLFIGHAKELGIGTPVRLQNNPVDPYNPYETLGR